VPVVTPDYVFGHMPKTGGTWAADYLRATTRSTFVGRSHWPLRLVPEHVWEDRRALGTWSWYGSWYLHAMCEPLARRRLSQIDGGATAFQDVLEGLLVRKDTLPRHIGAMWVFEEGGDWRDDFRESGLGLLELGCAVRARRTRPRADPARHGAAQGCDGPAARPGHLRGVLAAEASEGEGPSSGLWTPKLLRLLGAVDRELVGCSATGIEAGSASLNAGLRALDRSSFHRKHSDPTRASPLPAAFTMLMSDRHR